MRYTVIRYLFLVAALSSVITLSSTAQSFCHLADSTSTYRLDKYVGIYIDTTGVISIDQVSAPAFAGNFHQSPGNLKFGYLKSTLWLRVQLRQHYPQREWYLEIPAPFLEYIDFYQGDTGNWEHSRSGYYLPQSVRKVSHTGHVLPLRFGRDSMSTVYIRIAGDSPKTFPVYALSKDKFVSKVRYEDVGYGLFFGMLIAMFFYNFFIFLTLRQANFLLYMCTLVCTFLIFASASGYAGKFLWPEHPEVNFYAGRLTLGVLAIVLSIFTIRFLEVRKYSMVMYYILLTLIPLGVVADVLIITGWMSSAGNNLISLCTLVFMITGIVCRINGNRTATYFIAAWAIYLAGGLLLTLRNSAVFNFNFWTTHFVEIGAVAETTIIAFALADQYRRIRKEKEEAQALALSIKEQATEKLEGMVMERTAQLSTAYEELHATLETNKLQTTIIENKNAELDAFFYRISHDLKGPISSLLGLSFLARLDVKDELAQVYIEKQHTQVERLNSIITGLINLTKLNNSDLRKEKIDFNTLIDGCITSFQSLSNFSKIKFDKDVEAGIDFCSEWTLVNAIVQNLIENAIKYSRLNEPYVKISVYVVNADIVIKVQDNGQGIPPEHQSRIFDMFFRATSNSSGTGLGLYILKRSVDRLEGTIALESEVDIGSTFIVRLPL